MWPFALTLLAMAMHNAAVALGPLLGNCLCAGWAVVADGSRRSETPPRNGIEKDRNQEWGCSGGRRKVEQKQGHSPALLPTHRRILPQVQFRLRQNLIRTNSFQLRPDILQLSSRPVAHNADTADAAQPR